MPKLMTLVLAVALLFTAPLSFAREPLVDVIVVLKSPPSSDRAADNRSAAAGVARDLGLTPTRSYGRVLYGFAASVPKGRLAALLNDPRVDYINLDREVTIPPPAFDIAKGKPGGGGGGGGGGTSQTIPWGISAIHANSTSANGVDVYVIDSGIDTNHPDLGSLDSSTAMVSCTGRSTTCQFPWDDDNGHGTHVSGTVAALDNSRDVVGVAPGVKLHAVKVLNKNGSGTWSGVIAGIDWVASDKLPSSIVVANMSLGGGGTKGSGSCTATGYSPGGGNPDAMYQSICNAARQGVIFAVAAGNSGANAANSIPAAYYDAVITVSAMGINSQIQYDWPYWSNWGLNNDAGSGITTPSAPVTITAPGVSILSLKAGGGTTTLSGTSMAAPHVAGALALIIANGLPASGYAALTGARGTLLEKSTGACPSGSSCSSGWNNTSGNAHYERFLNVQGL